MNTFDVTALPSVEEFLDSRFKAIYPAISEAHPARRSRVGVLRDGDENSLVLILTIMAERKFGPYNKDVHTPVWKDKNYANETWENIELLTPNMLRKFLHVSGRITAGTKEYQREYYKTHKLRVREWQREYRKRRSEKLKRLNALEQSGATLPSGVTAYDADMQERLDRLQEAFKDGKSHE